MSRTVVDSSVFIDAIKGRTSKVSATFKQLLFTNPKDIIVGDLVMYEVIRGMKGEPNRIILAELFEEMTIVEMVGTERAVRSANRYAILREKGITIRKAIDTLIASYCIDEDSPAALHRP